MGDRRRARGRPIGLRYGGPPLDAPLVVVLGAEGRGSARAQAAADHRVWILMRGEVASPERFHGGGGHPLRVGPPPDCLERNGTPRGDSRMSPFPVGATSGSRRLPAGPGRSIVWRLGDPNKSFISRSVHRFRIRPGQWTLGVGTRNRSRMAREIGGYSPSKDVGGYRRRRVKPRPCSSTGRASDL